MSTTNNSNNLKKVITLLQNLEMDASTDFRDIVYGIARNNPAVLLDVVDLLRNPPDPPDPSWQEQVQGYLKDGNKIAAIKIYREATGMGLREAKEAVEEMPECRKF